VVGPEKALISSCTEVAKRPIAGVNATWLRSVDRPFLSPPGPV
jgi:hypothetical protein